MHTFALFGRVLSNQMMSPIARTLDTRELGYIGWEYIKEPPTIHTKR